MLKMSEYGEKDLAQIFEQFDNRLKALEGEKYPTTSREEFMSACLKDKSMEECSELWQKASKGEQAYGKPYGTPTTRKVVKTILRRAGIKLSEEDENKLIAQLHPLLVGKETGETFEGERLVPVYGAQGELIAFQTPHKGGESFGEKDMRTVSVLSVLPQEPTSRNWQFERDLQETADLIMRRGKYSNIAHQEQ